MLEKSKISFNDLLSEIISVEKKVLTSSGSEKEHFEKKLLILREELNNAVSRTVRRT